MIALETDYPAAIRRQVSFCEAVYDGSATVEGLTARLLPALNDAETISGINDTPQAHIASQKWKSSAIEAVGAVLEAGEVPLLIDPTGESIALFQTGCCGRCHNSKEKSGHHNKYGTACDRSRPGLYGRQGRASGD